MQRRHRARLDVAAEPRAHDELGAGAELLHERRQLAEVVGAVAVAHQDVLAADVRQRVDVGAPEAALRRAQHARAARQRQLGRCGRCRCRRSGSRRRCRPRCRPSWHQATKSAMVSSSFSAGMTIDSSGSGDVAPAAGARTSGRTGARDSRHDAHIRPAFMSGIIASIDWRSASREERSQRQPSALDAVRVEAHDRHVALPAAVAARVLEAHAAGREADALDGQLGDLAHRDVVAGRDVVDLRTARSVFCVREEHGARRRRRRGCTTCSGCRRRGCAASRLLARRLAPAGGARSRSPRRGSGAGRPRCRSGRRSPTGRT